MIDKDKIIKVIYIYDEEKQRHISKIVEEKKPEKEPEKDKYKIKEINKWHFRMMH